MPAMQVPGVIETCWKPLGVPTETLDLGSRQVHNNYRRMIPWISRVQVVDVFTIVQVYIYILCTSNPTQYASMSHRSDGS